MSQNLSITQSGAVARITLTQPEIRNAFSDEVIAEITAAFVDVGSRADVRAVVLAAEGPAFCAGANLNWMRRMADYTQGENIADAGKLAEMLRVIYTCPKPTIARVQGDVYAGGMGLVACCDMAVAASHAGFCLSEVKIGLIPATISPYVIRAIGERQAYRYFQTAERIPAARARELGLVHEVTTDDGLDTQVEALIEALLTGGPQAQAAATDLIRAVANRPITDALVEDTARRIATLRATDEAREGLAAFLDKRPAAWTLPSSPDSGA